MKNNKILFGILLLCSILYACSEKQIPAPVQTDEPKFAISGKIDGKPFSYVAGEGGYVGKTNTIKDSTTNLRIWQFSIADTDQFGSLIAVITVIHTSPATLSENDELKLAIKSSYSYSFIDPNIPPSETDPIVMVQITGQLDDIYLSDAVYPQSDTSFFNSSEATDVFKNEKYYRYMNCTFQCKAEGYLNKKIVTITEGKASVVFGGL